MKADVKFQVRMPQDVREALEADARQNDRSMNLQVISILRERYRALGLLPSEDPTPDPPFPSST
jgi:hypothetical protein